MRQLAYMVAVVVVVCVAGCEGGEGEGEGDGAGDCGLDANSCDGNVLRFCNGSVVAEDDCGVAGGFCDAVTLVCQGLDSGARCDANHFCSAELACDDGVCVNAGGDCDVDEGAAFTACAGVCLNDCDGGDARHCVDGANTVAVDCDVFADEAGVSCQFAGGASACLIPFEGVCSRGLVDDPARVVERCNGADLVCLLDDTDRGTCAVADVDVGADGCAGDRLYRGLAPARDAIDCGSFGYSCVAGQCVGRTIGESCNDFFACDADSVCINGTCAALVGECPVDAGEFISDCPDTPCNLPERGICDGALNVFCIDGNRVSTSDCVAYADDPGATCATDDVLGFTGCQVPDGGICLRALPDIGDYFEVCASDDGIGCVEDENGIGHCLPAADCVSDPNNPFFLTCDGDLLHANCLFSGHAYDLDCSALGATCRVEDTPEQFTYCDNAVLGAHCNDNVLCGDGLACIDHFCANVEDVCPIVDGAEFRVCDVPCPLQTNQDACTGHSVLHCNSENQVVTINCDSDGTTAICDRPDTFNSGCLPDDGAVCTKFVPGFGTYFGICTGDPATTGCVENPQGFGHCTTTGLVDGNGCVGDVLAVRETSGHLYNIDCGDRGGFCEPINAVCVGVDAGFACGPASQCGVGLLCGANGLCE